VRVLVIETQRTVPIGSLGPPLLAAGLEIVNWRSEEGPPPSLADFAGVVALGGASNPDQDDRYPWLAKERELLGKAVDGRLPTIGSCLGAELLAEVLGAVPMRLARPEIGWFELEQTGAARDDPLAARLPQRFPALQWHSYGFALPPDATVLAGSEHAMEAFSRARRAWALQFHLEADERIISDWLTDYEDVLREPGLDARSLARETERRAPVYARYATAVGRAVVTRVKRLARAPTGSPI
jgi:GMP synthase (glutamine-hydrolysing)